MQISTDIFSLGKNAGISEKSTFKELKAPFTYGNPFPIDWHFLTP